MPLLFWLTISATVYVCCFKDDFSKEHIDKVVPFLSTVAVVIIVLGSLLSALGG